jgi:predicted MPP superfamily phosphohydrolase
MNRRQFVKRASLAAASSLAVGIAYPFLEAKWCHIVRRTVSLPGLPSAFQGLTIALLSDTHHGPYVPIDYLRHVVEMTNNLEPDLVLLGGDYVYGDVRHIAPGIDVLANLTARIGRFAVRGNHDNREFTQTSRDALAKAKLPDLSNSGVWIERQGARLRICGVGDLWTDRQDLNAALNDANPDDTVILLSHNPDFVESIRDPRVSLVLSGHTHGGQVVIPGYGAPIVPSRFGQKYVHGLVQGPRCPVYITRGVGTISPPVRFLCRPEIVLLTLVA